MHLLRPASSLARGSDGSVPTEGRGDGPLGGLRDRSARCSSPRAACVQTRAADGSDIERSDPPRAKQLPSAQGAARRGARPALVGGATAGAAAVGALAVGMQGAFDGGRFAGEQMGGGGDAVHPLGRLRGFGGHGPDSVVHGIASAKYCMVLLDIDPRTLSSWDGRSHERERAP